jgi:hypothetical protein
MPAADNQTPSAGLTYNVRIGSVSDSFDIVSPMADVSTGRRLLPKFGNAGLNTFYKITLPPGEYYWSVQAIDNCYSGGAFATEQEFCVLPDNPAEICMVSVDSSINSNLIIWERLANAGAGIDYYNIYKENASAVYEVIGTVPYDSLSVFTDTASNPMIQAEKYKISAVDQCGTESALSDFHQTIHLNINLAGGGGRNLQWNHYMDELGQIAFGPEGTGSYYIYRGTHPDSLLLYYSLSRSNQSWTDPDTSDVFYYRITAEKNTACSPAVLVKASNGPYSQSLSNVEDNRLKGNEINHTYNPDWNVKVYPNPVTDAFTIYYDLFKESDVTISLCNTTGETIQSIFRSRQTPGPVAITHQTGNSLAPGMYFIKLEIDGRITIAKLIRQ